MDSILNKPTTPSIALNAPLLFAILGVIIASITLHFSSTFTLAPTTLGDFLSLLAVVVFFFMLIYSLLQLGIQARRCWQDPSASSTLCQSAFLGCLLLGVLSLSLTNQSSTIGAIAFALDILAIFGFLFFITSSSPQATVSSDNQMPTQPNQTDQKTQRPSPIKDLPLRPPLFVNDPLFQLPVLEGPLVENCIYQVFSAPKPGEHAVSNEDACVISQDQKVFALCDGASNSAIAARPWASLLGKQWLKSVLYPKSAHQRITADDLEKWLREPSTLWARWVRDTWFPTVNHRNQQVRDRLVAAETMSEMVRQGADATFLGVRLSHSRPGWFATAIGDTCLFLVSQHPAGPFTLAPILPIQHSADFNLAPPLLSSTLRNDLIAAAAQNSRSTFMNYRPTDVGLLMATDAFAHWLMMQLEETPPKDGWQTLFSLNSQEKFQDFVYNLQKRGLMEIDDTTLLVIYLPTEAGNNFSRRRGS